ncbi:YlxR family protein [bacterium]|nr:YlxR family protein [bacterium]
MINSSTKNICYRTCLLTKKKRHKTNLIRFVKNNDNYLTIDAKQTIKCRGFYLSKDPSLVSKDLPIILAKKTKTKINLNLLEQLNNFFKNKE